VDAEVLNISAMPTKPVVVVRSVNMDLVVRCEHLPRPGQAAMLRRSELLPSRVMRTKTA
jgi:hypothetical protein